MMFLIMMALVLLADMTNATPAEKREAVCHADSFCCVNWDDTCQAAYDEIQ